MTISNQTSLNAVQVAEEDRPVRLDRGEHVTIEFEGLLPSQMHNNWQYLVGGQCALDQPKAQVISLVDEVTSIDTKNPGSTMHRRIPPPPPPMPSPPCLFVFVCFYSMLATSLNVYAQ